MDLVLKPAHVRPGGIGAERFTGVVERFDLAATDAYASATTLLEILA